MRYEVTIHTQNNGAWTFAIRIEEETIRQMLNEKGVALDPSDFPVLASDWWHGKVREVCQRIINAKASEMGFEPSVWQPLKREDIVQVQDAGALGSAQVPEEVFEIQFVAYSPPNLAGKNGTRKTG